MTASTTGSRDVRGEVLVVEDNPYSLKLLSDLLENGGYAVRQAPNGELALWSAHSRPPDLMLLDVRMPGIDGYEVCRRLKLDAALRDIPVIFLSAQSDTDARLRGFAAGAIDFIGKPYQADEVMARTAAHVALARSQRELAQTNTALARALERLVDAQDELRRVERLAALGAMVAGIAHELNTPIGTSLLASSTLAERVRELAARAAGGGLRRSDLHSFITDCSMAASLIERNLGTSARLIDSFKQAAAGQESLVRRSFQLGELLDEISRRLAPQVQLAGASLVVAAGGDIAMSSFPGALDQVLDQLIANALLHGLGGKYSYGGTIRIDASAQNSLLTLSVCDDGAGIDAALLPRVFDPFFTTRMGQGTGGLGLHIVHNLVRNVLGGTIEVRSGPGATCFVIDCPCQAPALANQGSSSAPPLASLRS